MFMIICEYIQIASQWVVLGEHMKGQLKAMKDWFFTLKLKVV